MRLSLAVAAKLLITAAAVVPLAACNTTPALPQAPAKAATSDYTYLIGPGDSINVTVWRNPELSTTIPVRPDGKINAPLVDDLVAIGKTPSQLAREIEKSLSKYLQDPIVTVVVTNFVGVYSEQIRVVGEATRPAALAYRQGMSLLDVMIAVGGITEFASGNRAVLVRQSDSNRQYNLRLADLLKRGDVSANVELKPGDVIIIPESWF